MSAEREQKPDMGLYSLVHLLLERYELGDHTYIDEENLQTEIGKVKNEAPDLKEVCEREGVVYEAWKLIREMHGFPKDLIGVHGGRIALDKAASH